MVMLDWNEHHPLLCPVHLEVLLAAPLHVVPPCEVKWWVLQICRFCTLTPLMKPLALLVMAAAPTVQKLIQFVQLNPPVQDTQSSQAKSPLRLFCEAWFAKFSLTWSLSIVQTLVKSWACPLTSVDSSTCKESFLIFLMFFPPQELAFWIPDKYESNMTSGCIILSFLCFAVGFTTFSVQLRQDDEVDGWNSELSNSGAFIYFF